MRARLVSVLFLISFLITVPFSGSCSALRSVEVGQDFPDLELKGLSGDASKLTAFMGEKGVVAIYWATWSSHSLDFLAFAEKSLKGYEAKGIKVVGINVEHQEMKVEDMDVVKAKVAELGITFPVVIDPGLVGYDKIGVVSTPTTVVVSKDMKLVEVFPGFPTSAREDVPARLDAMLGIVKEEKTAEAKTLLEKPPKGGALQMYNLGKKLLLSSRSLSGELKALPDSALARLDDAIRKDPDYVRPYVAKSFVYHLAKETEKRDAVIAEMKARGFKEPMEKRLMALVYLRMDMDAAATEMLVDADGTDLATIFAKALLLARKSDPGAKGAVDALKADPKAAEVLGADPASLFADDGKVKPDASDSVAVTLERLLDLAKGGQGRAPVMITAPPPNP